MGKLIATLCKPVTVPVAACASRVAAMDEPLKRHIDACTETGEDICDKVWREYFSSQRRLVPYRVKQFWHEVAYLGSGQLGVATLSFHDAVIFARYATKCLLIFIIAVMVGRRSVYPSLEPTSPFAEEIVKNWQPNHVAHYENNPREWLLERTRLFKLEQKHE